MSCVGVSRVACAHGEASMSRRPETQLVLSQSEREQLEALTLRRKTAQAVALRARIVLGCAAGVENKAVAARQRVSEQTVCKWRARFVEHRLDGLLDAPRRGAPRTIDDARVDAVIAKTLESVPDGATHWSTRSTRQLEQAIRNYLDVHNSDPKPFVWSKSADDILASVERFCLRTSNSRH